MATFNWPGFGIAAITPTLDQPAQVNRSAYTGVRAIASNPWHGKWSFKVQLATKQGDANFQAIRAFFTGLKGSINNFHLPAVEQAQNANTGVTLSAGASQGATSLALTGVTTALVAGNLVTIAGQLLSLTSVGSLSGGAQTISFMPALRAAASSGASVETAKPYALVALSDSSFSWDIAQWRQYGLSFTADEDVGGTDGADPALDNWSGGIGTGSGSGGTSFSFPQLPSFISRSLLAAVVSPTDKQVAYLTEAGREGEFVFTTANVSAMVSADTVQNFYVAPSSDTSGASGAWVRKPDASVVADLGTEDFSASPSAEQIAVDMDKTFAGHSAADSDYRSLLITSRYTGAFGAFQMNGGHIQTEIRHTSGTLSFGQGVEGYVRLGLADSTTGDITAARVFSGHVANESASGVISAGSAFFAGDTDYGDDVGAGGTMGTVNGFACGNLSHATKLTTAAYGFFAANMTTPGTGVTVAAFGTEMAGAGKWSFLGKGSSPSAIVGNLRIGDNTVPTHALEVAGAIRAMAGGSIGFGAGVGGTVTQSTSKSTDVTLSKPCGQITMNAASLAANTIVAFNFANDQIEADDDVRVWVKSGNASVGSYRVASEGNGAGSRRIVVENKTAGALAEALVLGFNILKVTIA